MFRNKFNKKPLIILDGMAYLSSVDDLSGRHALAREVREILNREVKGTRMTKPQMENNFDFVRSLEVVVTNTTVTAAEALAAEKHALEVDSVPTA